MINRSGVILGEPSGGPTNSHVLWKPSGSDYVLQDIPPAPDGYRPITRAMNDNGELAGWGQRGAELFYWSEATGWLPIQVPSGATACQTFDGINNNGVIVAKCIVNGLTNAYVWSNHDAAPQQLPTPLGYSEAYPEDINDAGVVVGYANGSQQRAVQWTPNGASYSVTVLADAGYGSVANAIAENGTIAGSLHRSKGSSPSPVYWTGVNSYRLLGMDKSGSWGEALDIASGQLGLVVGGHRGNTQALRWRQ